MKDYRAFYEKNTAFLRRLKNPCLVLTVFDKLLTATIGALYLAGGILAACGVFGKALPTLFACLLPPVCALLVVTLLRLIIPRKRPYAKDGAAIDPICQKAGEKNSFPSRHAACAFVIGVTLCAFALWLGLPALFLSCLLCYGRFLCGFHFPTDLIAGAVLGGGFGALAFVL